MKHLEIDTNHSYKRVAAAILIFFSFALGAQNPLGEEYFPLDPEPVTGQSFGPVTSLALSPSDGSLWIGTEDEGILRIGRKGNRIHYSVASKHLSSDCIKEMCFNSSSVLYILYENGNLARYSSTQGFSDLRLFDEGVSHVLMLNETDQLLCSTDSGKIYTVDAAGATNLIQAVNEPVAVLSASTDGYLYFVGETSRVVKQVVNGGIQDKSAVIPDLPTSLLVAQDGVIWAGTGQGLYCWPGSSWKRYNTADGLPSNRVNTIVQARHGEILIATYGGIVSLNVSESNVSNSKVYNQSDSYLSAVKVDGNNPVCFFGGDRGIAVLTPESVAVSLPWNDPVESGMNRQSKPFNWIWLLVIPALLIFGLLGFFIGCRNKQRNDYIQSSDLLIPPPSSTIVSPVKKDTVATAPAQEEVPSSPDSTKEDLQPSDLQKVIERLNGESSELPEFSVKVWKMINESYADPHFSVETIASRLLLSRVHVNRKLRQEIGVSPSALIKAKRMSAARELLLGGKMTLPQVALKAGFSSATYLSASFKDYYGQSPSELMRSL